MDRRVRQAMALLKEAGRLDLLAAPVAPKERPVRKAASGVAAAVVACSPPRERTQVSRAFRGRSGRLALAARGRVKAAPKGRPRPLGARRPLGRDGGAAGGAAGISPVAKRRGQRGAPSGSSVAQGEGGREERPRSEAREKIGGPEEHREGKSEGNKLSTGLLTQPTGTRGAWGVGPTGGEEGHVLTQETVSNSSEEGSGCTLGEWYGATGETGVEGSKTKRVDGDPGELLTGLEPWEEEEVLAGPSTASWTGYRRGGKAVRAKDLVQQRATGLGSVPPSGRPRYIRLICKTDALLPDLHPINHCDGYE
ncbi:hypothetical protein NDU88_001936 [Pleurodeles waltl]|uniref:Uncharacterized protein n=1 Tax=Pleurodeles waltl TaxID=8319 RepID=A0AAV7WN74_PLEWA|nr:hypothetical protein NDU88_001936 [Pleurodeles waltl]